MNQRTIVLNCEFLAWRHERLVEYILDAQREPEAAPKRLPFTFNHLPFELADEGRDVVLIPIGAKS